MPTANTQTVATTPEMAFTIIIDAADRIIAGADPVLSSFRLKQNTHRFDREDVTELGYKLKLQLERHDRVHHVFCAMVEYPDGRWYFEVIVFLVTYSN